MICSCARFSLVTPCLFNFMVFAALLVFLGVRFLQKNCANVLAPAQGKNVILELYLRMCILKNSWLNPEKF